MHRRFLSAAMEPYDAFGPGGFLFLQRGGFGLFGHKDTGMALGLETYRSLTGQERMGSKLF
jgi:hypothetical protein